MRAGILRRNWFLLVTVLALILGLTISAYFYLAGAAVAFGFLTATQSALIQEIIDASAILWALTPLALRLKKEHQ